MKKNHFPSISVFLALLLFLSGCGQASYDKSTGSAMDSNSNGWYDGADMELEESVTTERPSADVSENDLINRKLIKTVNLTMETKEFDSLKASLEELIDTYGGYVETSNYYDPQRADRYRSYTLTIRVPADSLDSFVEQAGHLGTLTNKYEYVDDITLTYIDMTAYMESLQVEYDKVLELLEQAVDLDQVLVLESKLSELRYEINSYASKLRAYDSLIAYSTIHLTINEVEYETVTENSVGTRIRTGFAQSLNSVKVFFVNLFVFFVSNLPVLFVYAILIVIILVLFANWRKRRKANPPKKRKKDKKETPTNAE